MRRPAKFNKKWDILAVDGMYSRESPIVATPPLSDVALSLPETLELAQARIVPTRNTLAEDIILCGTAGSRRGDRRSVRASLRHDPIPLHRQAQLGRKKYRELTAR